MQRPQSIVVSSTSSITSSSSLIVFNVPLRNEKGNSRDVTYHLPEGSPAILVLWARWLSAKATKFARFGLLRMVRDLLHISGHIKILGTVRSGVAPVFYLECLVVEEA